MILMRAPPAPFVPEVAHGTRICTMTVCYSGDLDDVDEVLAPIWDLREPVVDLLQAQPYTRLQSFLDETNPKGMHYYWKTEFAAELSDDLLSTMRDLSAGAPYRERSWLLPTSTGHSTNATKTTDLSANRDVRFIYGISGKWEPDESDAEQFRRWVRDAWTRIRPSLDRRQLRQLPDRRRRRGAYPGDLRRQLRPRRRSEDDVRPDQRVPLEPERPSENDLTRILGNGLCRAYPACDEIPATCPTFLSSDGDRRPWQARRRSRNRRS